MTLLLVFIINTALVLVTIVIHYEVLFQLSKRLPEIKKITPSYKVLICVFTIFLAHVVEIWLFGLGYYFSSQLDGIGNLFGFISILVYFNGSTDYISFCSNMNASITNAQSSVNTPFTMVYMTS